MNVVKTMISRIYMRCRYAKFCVITFVILFFASSCSNSNDSKQPNDDNVLSKVENYYLYKSDILKLLPQNLDAEDSVKLVSEYITNWNIEKLLFIEAQKKLKDTSELVERINQYREQLYLYYYLEKEIYPKINKTITDKTIEEYYKNNMSNFILTETYVKAFYFVIDADFYSYYDILEKIANSTLKDEQKLKDLCIGTNRKFCVQENWIPLRTFLESINYPSNITDNELPYIPYLDFVYKDKRYLLKFDSYQLKGSNTPLELLHSDIAQIILNNRKRDEYISLKNNLLSDFLESTNK